MMFGEEVSGRFLAKWPCYFKNKVIAESQSLPSSPHIEELRASVDPEAEDYLGKYGTFFCIESALNCYSMLQ